MLVVIALALGWLALRARRDASRRGEANERPAIPDRARTNPLNLPGGGVAPADAYQVYADLYRAPLDEPLVIAEDSVVDIPQLDGSCLHPSNPAEEQMVHEFEAANHQKHRWEKKFAVSEYQQVSRAEADRITSCLDSARATGSPCASYPEVRHVRYLGIPGFDNDHSQALVSVIRMCGADCGSGGIFAVKKEAGRWVRAENTSFTSDCSWMY
jgi:hypothetical protein